MTRAILFEQAYIGDNRADTFRYEQTWSFGLRDFAKDEGDAMHKRVAGYFPEGVAFEEDQLEYIPPRRLELLSCESFSSAWL